MSGDGDMEAVKGRLRARVRERLEAMAPGERLAQAALLADRVRQLAAGVGSRWVGAYLAMPGEPDLGVLIDEWMDGGRRVAVPSFDGATGLYRFREIRDRQADLVRGRFGVFEPRWECPEVPMTLLDFVLVPGIAFDRSGGRLGRGKGFYDRLLAPVTGVTCGVCLEPQLVPEVPMAAHDVRLKLVATPWGLHGPGLMDKRC